MEKRAYNRKLLDPIHVTDMQIADRSMILARGGTVLNASATGLLIEIQPHDLGPEFQNQALTFDAIRGEEITMKVAEMSLEIEGSFVRSHQTAQGSYEIAIDFAANAPAYWRESFAELLPQQGECHRIEHAHFN
jgi:hypothetical protein